MELSSYIIDALVFVLTCAAYYAWNKYIKPYIEEKHLNEIADIVVHYAEALYGAGKGQEKLACAIQMFREKFGVDIDEDRIVMLIEAAWKAMDIEQKS